MDAAALLELIERSRRSEQRPLSEPLTSALGAVLLGWLAGEHAQEPARLHRETFARVGCMSPEQARGRPLDVRSDVFSAGALLFELCCGRRPFAGVNELVAGDLDAPQAVNPALSPGLAAVLQRALAPEAAQRFANAAELRAALEGAVPPAGPDEVAAWGRSLEVPVAPPSAAAAPAEPRPRTQWWSSLMRGALAATLVTAPLALTIAGLHAWEQHQLDTQAAYAAQLMPCEILSEPPGAVLIIDGRSYPGRAPTVVRLEPGREYLIEIHGTQGAVTRRVKDQKKLAVRLADGVVLANEIYGVEPPSRPQQR